VDAKDREGEMPGADVRPFLPRPGEPAEAYAARLRALHSDLTLVLEAVERGLATRPAPVSAVPGPDAAPAGDAPPATAGHTTPGREDDPGGDVHAVPVVAAALRDPQAGAAPAAPGEARVETVPPAGAAARRQGEERRAAPAPPAPPAAPAAPARPAAVVAGAGDAPPDADVRRAPAGAAAMPAAGRGGGSAPLLLATLVLGALTVVALVLALLVVG
jgi:hypothetical protein